MYADGLGREEGGVDALPEENPRSAVAPVMREVRFWGFTLAFAVASVAAVASTVHLIPYLTERSHSPMFAASALGAVGLMQLPGRLAFGPLRRALRREWTAAAVLLLSLAVMAVVGPRPRGFWIRLAIIAMMAAIALYSGFVLTTRITGLQSQVQGPIQNLPATDPRRAEFGRLHGLANVLMLVNMAGGLALLIWEARD